MKKVFITRRMPEIAKTILKEHFEVSLNDKNETLTQDELIRSLKDCDAVLSTVLDKFTKEVIDSLPKLKVISSYASGLDNIDMEHAKTKGIYVYNIPDSVTNSTADLTMASFLALARKLWPAREFVREGKWKAWDPEILLGEELTGKTFGIIGFGRIGMAVAKRALGFGMNVIYFNRSPVVSDCCKAVTLEELLSESDYISLHVPLTEQTRGMINAESIRKMSKRPILINFSRGQIIKTEDLLNALKNGEIRGAVLDVTDPEPISADHLLCKMENCIITPHIGTATKECRRDMAMAAAEKIIKHFSENE